MSCAILLFLLCHQVLELDPPHLAAVAPDGRFDGAGLLFPFPLAFHFDFAPFLI